MYRSGALVTCSQRAPVRSKVQLKEGTNVNISMPVWAEQIAVFDSETTGIDTAQSRVVSATIALLDVTGQAIERYDWLLNPGVEIPEQATQVHGISTEMARTKGTSAAHGIQQIVEQLENMLNRGYPVVVYNAPYDLTLMRHEAKRHGVPFPTAISPVLDPLILDKQLDRYRKGKRTLSVVAEHYGVQLDHAHDSGADAIASGQILQLLSSKYREKLPEDVVELHNLQVRWAAEQAENFQQFMRRSRDPNFIAEGMWPVR